MVNEDQELYRLSSELSPPLPLWLWRGLPKRRGWPSQALWLRRAEQRVLWYAARTNVTPVGGTLAVAETRGKVVVISASLLGYGEPGRDVPRDNGPVDIVDQDRGDR